jgi:hypothetical protein
VGWQSLAVLLLLSVRDCAVMPHGRCAARTPLPLRAVYAASASFLLLLLLLGQVVVLDVLVLRMLVLVHATWRACCWGCRGAAASTRRNVVKAACDSTKAAALNAMRAHATHSGHAEAATAINSRH